MTRKPIFDAVRVMLGRGFTPTEIKRLDMAIDEAMGDTPVADGWLPLALDIIKKFEGLAKIRADGMVEAYPDPASGGAPWTIGYGSTGSDIAKGTVWTRSQCEARLLSDLTGRFGPAVDAMAAPVTARQKAALCSFVYNLGEDALKRSTLLRKHLDGNYAGAADEFSRWTFAGGKQMRGLIARREAEAALYQN